MEHEMNDFIAYDVSNMLYECFDKEHAKHLTAMVVPEIKRTISKHYKREELKTLLGKVLTNLTKEEKL